MVDKSFYVLVIGMIAVGLVLTLLVFLPLRGMGRYPELTAPRYKFRKALSIGGIGLTLVGLVMLVALYRDRHVEADGVIYVPPALMDALLFIGLVLVVLGGLRVTWLKLARRGNAAERSALKSEPETATMEELLAETEADVTIAK